MNIAQKVDALNWQMDADNLDAAIANVRGEYFYVEDAADPEAISGQPLTDEEIERLYRDSRASFLETACDCLRADGQPVERFGDGFLIDGQIHSVTEFVIFARERGAITTDNLFFAA